MLILISALISIESNAQSTTAFNTYNSAFYLGWNTANDLPFRIGTGATAPLMMMLKSSGDLNITNAANGYQINDNYVLRHNGNTNDIFVGHLAGNATMTGHKNTYMGYSAGTATTIGSENTFIGNQAGLRDTSGGLNVFVGQCAGRDNLTGGNNTFIGHWAGSFSSDCYYNTAVGTYALGEQVYAPASGNDTYNTAVGAGSLDETNGGIQNCAIGTLSGYSNSTGNENVFVGDSAGFSNDTGSNNTFVGNSADANASGLTNATAIGSGAIVTNVDNLILGDRYVSVGVGLSGVSGGALAKLHVRRDYADTRIQVDGPIGVKVETNDIGIDEHGPQISYGETIDVTGDNAINYGLYSNVAVATTNYGGYFITKDIEARDNIGVYGHSENGEYNYGVWGDAPSFSSENTTFNVGVYGTAPITHSSLGYGAWAGYFDGDLGNTGTLFSLSDANIKTQIEPLSNAAEILSHLNSYSFYFDTVQLSRVANVSSALQFGLMAQEVEAVAPNLVLNTILPPQLDSIGQLISPIKPVKMVNYIGLIPLLVEGYNKQQARIDSLVEIVSQLTTTGQRSNDSPNQNTQHLTTELSDGNAIVLDQNSPNPFAEQTKITWNIPTDNTEVGSSFDAKLFFYNRAGTILKTVKIEVAGYGELIVYANNLSNGEYTYTLVVNGKVIDTKKMVKVK